MADSFELDREPKQICDVPGFRTGAASSGVKGGTVDVGVIKCETAAKLGWGEFLGKLKGGTGAKADLTTSAHGAGGAVFSSRVMKAAPVEVSETNGASGTLRAVVVNNGNANCYMGRYGVRAAEAMLSAAAKGLDVPEGQVIVASAGPAGAPFPRDKIVKGVKAACADALEGGKGDFESVLAAGNGPCVRASASGTYDGKPFTIAGIARRCADDVLDMTPMFTFLATDLAINNECLMSALSSVYDQTYACAVTDPALGANDTLCLLASGLAQNTVIDVLFSATVLTEALTTVVKSLMVGPGTGGVHGPYEVRVLGASTETEAGTIANSMAWSALVREALSADPPAWERIVSAAGSSAPRIDLSLCSLQLCGETVFIGGRPAEEVSEDLPGLVAAGPVTIEFDLGVSDCEATMWSYPKPTAKTDEVAAAERRAEEAGAAARQSIDAANRVKQLEREVASLRAERDGLAEKVSAADSAGGEDVAALEEKLAAAEAALEKANANAASELEAVRAELEQQADEAKAKAEADLAQAVAARDEFEKERDALRASVEELEKARDEAASGADEARADLEARLEEAIAARTQLEEQVAGLEQAGLESANEAADARTKLEGKLSDAESARKEAKGEVKEALAKVAELEKELEKTRKDAASTAEATEKGLKEKLAEITKERDAAARQREELESKMADLVEVANRASALEKEAGDKAAEADAAKRESSAKIAEATAAKDAVEKKLAEAETAAEQAKKEAESKLAEATAAREAVEKERDGARAELEKAKKDADGAVKAAQKDAAKEAAKEGKEVAAALKKAESGLEKAQEKLEAVEAERDDVKAKLKELKKAAKEALSDFSKTQKVAEKERKELEAKIAELEGQSGDSEETKKRLAELEKKLEEAEAARDEATKGAGDAQAIEANIKKIKAERDEKAKQLEKVTSERDEALGQVEETKQMLAQAMEKAKSKEATADAASDDSKEVKKLKKLIKQYESAHQSAREEVGKLHAKYEATASELQKVRAELQLKEQLVQQLLAESKK